MKYGSELQENVFAPWRLSYIAYDVLKMELKTRQLDHEWNDQDEADFIQLLHNELNKVYDFVTAKLREVEARITYCERTITTFQKNPSMSSEANWGIMDDALTEVLFDVNDLAKFTRVNYIGFQKILKKHDKWTHRNLQHSFIEALRSKPLDKQRFDVAIVYISSLHDLCRLRGHPRNGNSAAGGDQNAFERATAKYWIHPDNVTEVKAIIMLHLPVLVFNQNKKYEASDSAISSVYYDNYDFDLYTGRLQRDEGAEAIRFRWYGPYESPNVFIERKTHHAAWLNGTSVKDRFPLKEDKVNSYVAGEYTPEQIVQQLKHKGVTDDEIINNVEFISTGVQTSIKEKHLTPICRIFYNRTAFQLPGDQRLRISLDSDMTYIREDDIDGGKRRENNNWRRTDAHIDYPFSDLPQKDVYRFPYAVLETKLQTHLGQEPPQWLTTLLESHLVHEVPRFSKYLHGASYFYQERLPLLPWWLSEMTVDIRKPRSMNAGLSRSKSFKPLIDGQYRHAMEEEERRL
ncbi:VTC domain-containing protein, partial [Umbelopsis sp. PMI_123]